MCAHACVCLKNPQSIQQSPALISDWNKCPSRTLLVIVEYLFTELLVLFLGSLYYATSALNFKCDKQGMSVGGRWLMTASDRAFKSALFSGKRYFHVNLLCVLQLNNDRVSELLNSILIYILSWYFFHFRPRVSIQLLLWIRHSPRHWG